MRRRSFRPALESLDFRIALSDVTGPVLAAQIAVTTPFMSSDAGNQDGNDNPLWNEPSDLDSPPAEENPLWCPMVSS